MTRSGSLAIESAEKAAAKSNRRHRVRKALGVTAVVLVIMAAFGAVIGWPAWLRSNDNRNTDARVKAVAAYMKPVAAATDGQLKLDTYGDSKDSATHTNNRTYFYVVVGNCPAVEAYVTSPVRPKLTDKLGPLHVVIPGENPDAASAEPVINWSSDSWTEAFLRKGSGLKHCLKK